MGLDHSRIGERAGPYREEVSAERLAGFARAVGASAAPPTFITICRRGEFDLLTRLGVTLSQVLHGEQEYEYAGAIRVGDVLSYETSLTREYEKKGSTHSMRFLVFETRVQAGENGGARPVGTARTTVIVRGGARPEGAGA